MKKKIAIVVVTVICTILSILAGLLILFRGRFIISSNADWEEVHEQAGWIKDPNHPESLIQNRETRLARAKKILAEEG